MDPTFVYVQALGVFSLEITKWVLCCWKRWVFLVILVFEEPIGLSRLAGFRPLPGKCAGWPVWGLCQVRARVRFRSEPFGLVLLWANTWIKCIVFKQSPETPHSPTNITSPTCTFNWPVVNTSNSYSNQGCWNPRLINCATDQNWIYRETRLDYLKSLFCVTHWFHEKQIKHF